MGTWEVRDVHFQRFTLAARTRSPLVLPGLCFSAAPAAVLCAVAPAWGRDASCTNAAVAPGKPDTPKTPGATPGGPKSPAASSSGSPFSQMVSGAGLRLRAVGRDVARDGPASPVLEHRPMGSMRASMVRRTLPRDGAAELGGGATAERGDAPAAVQGQSVDGRRWPMAGRKTEL